MTVLFCDIVGSTSLAEALGPERMHELLEAFFELALAEVHRYEGTINQFLGDGFMALFGAPLALERHAQHAALAALAIRRALRGQEREPAQDVDEKIRLRMGLHSGWVVVGKIGDNLRMDYTAVGDTTNVAARLLGLSEPGAILLSDSTAALLGNAMRVERIGPTSLKGRRAEVTLYRLLGVESRQLPTERAAGQGLTPFVGRRTSLDVLAQVLAEAERGRGQVVGLVGEPGMGKSRLLLEFRRVVSERRAAYVVGQCVAYGTTTPYLPIIDIVRQAGGILDADTPGIIVSKVRASLEAVGLDPDEGAPYLLSLLGVKETRGTPQGDAPSPEIVKARTFDVVRQLCLRGSRRRPIVLAIEDLQWIDNASEELISSLIDSIAGAPVMFATTYRPGYTPPWLGKSYATQITLHPLTRDESLAVLEASARTGRVHGDLAESIVTRADGNPFILEELARSIGDHPSAVDRTTIPDSVHGMFLDRIDRLPEETRSLLQTASVIGREVPLRLLQATLRDPSDRIPLLADLARLEFLYEDLTAPEPLYVFRHAITQDAVYGSLLDSRRRHIHGQVGDALERLYSGRWPEVAELLAHHFAESADGEKAVDYALMAGEKAQRRWANSEALAYFTSASSRLPQLEDVERNRLRRIDAALTQVELSFVLGRLGEQGRALEEIHGLVADSGDIRRLAAWMSWMGLICCLTGGSPATALAQCREAAALAERANMPEELARAESCLAQVCFIAGDLRASHGAGQRALSRFEESGNLWWACRTLWALIATTNALGEWSRSEELCRQALEYGRTAGDTRMQVVAHLRLGSTLIQRGDVGRGFEALDDALALAPGPFDMAMLQAVRGYGQIKTGSVESGSAMVAEALAWFESSRLGYSCMALTPFLAEGYLKQGRAGDARALLLAARETSREAGYRYLEGLVERLLGESWLADDPTRAAQHLEAAGRILEEVGASHDLAKTWIAEGELCELRGDRTTAARLLERAAAIFEGNGGREDAEQARARIVR